MQSLSTWKKKILLQPAQKGLRAVLLLILFDRGPATILFVWRLHGGCPILFCQVAKTGREFGVKADKSFREYSSSEPLLIFGVRAPICVQHWLQLWQALKALCTSNCGFPFFQGCR
jgi:hypothetical protein